MSGPAPLAGIRVLDLSRVLAGPWCGQLLADYGADVIKVERPGSGDDTRGWGPPYWGDPAQGMAAYYLSTNRGKRSIAIDIASAEGSALVRQLAAEADVLLENYKVGQLAKYGLDYASLSALNPRLVYCSVTGYGQDGPYAQAAGYDFAIQATGGLMSVTGEKEGTPGSEPQKVGVAVSDLFTGVYSSGAVMAALIERGRTGRGRHIDAALLDVQVARRRFAWATPTSTSCPTRCLPRRTATSSSPSATTGSSSASVPWPATRRWRQTRATPATPAAWSAAPNWCR